MHKAVPILALAAATMLATAAQARPYRDYRHDDSYRDARTAGELGAGAVAGTVAGVGIYNGWWGSTVAGAALPTTAAGAAVAGGVVGVGTVAVIDAIVEPCRGFHAIFGLNKDACVDGHFVGYGPHPRYYR